MSSENPSKMVINDPAYMDSRVFLLMKPIKLQLTAGNQTYVAADGNKPFITEVETVQLHPGDIALLHTLSQSYIDQLINNGVIRQHAPRMFYANHKEGFHHDGKTYGQHQLFPAHNKTFDQSLMTHAHGPAALLVAIPGPVMVSNILTWDQLDEGDMCYLTNEQHTKLTQELRDYHDWMACREALPQKLEWNHQRWLLKEKPAVKKVAMLSGYAAYPYTELVALKGLLWPVACSPGSVFRASQFKPSDLVALWIEGFLQHQVKMPPTWDFLNEWGASDQPPVELDVDDPTLPLGFFL